MSGAQERLKDILTRNKARLGLRSETRNYENEITDLLNNLTLDNSTLDNLSTQNTIQNNSTMKNEKAFAHILPTFSGNQNHLESFINSIDDFHNLFYKPDDHLQSK